MPWAIQPSALNPPEQGIGIMKVFVFLLLFFLVSSHISFGQETLDFSNAAHWTGAVVLNGNPANPVISGNQILVVDGTHEVRRIDISDPYAPRILPSIPLGSGVNRI